MCRTCKVRFLKFFIDYLSSRGFNGIQDPAPLLVAQSLCLCYTSCLMLTVSTSARWMPLRLKSKLFLNHWLFQAKKLHWINLSS
ncbi:hypothetical protein BJX70DRAFT_360247 [Aspergillus crustosus]